MKLGDFRSVLTRIFHILNVSMSLLSSERELPTDPTAFLPAGYDSKPSIRQGRAKFKNASYVESLEKRMVPPRVTTELGEIEGYYMRVVSGRHIYAFEGIQNVNYTKL